ncbi:MAG TPA: hypothetical protein VMF69_26245 [Gemmataceae bacterium]|nr:hypothetical protein [Gemmataceae bacterium]
MIALLNWLRNLWLTLLASTRYAAIGGTAGAIFGLLALWLDRNPYMAFFLGACLPLGPFYFWFSSAGQIEKQLAAFQQWRAQKLISQNEYDELRGKALRWYAERLYGTQTPISSRRTKGDERTEP